MTLRPPILVGLALFLLVGGCVRDPDDFNAKAAGHICAYNDENPDSPFLDRTTPSEDSPTVDVESPFAPYGGPTCERDVADNLDVCHATCDYSPRKGRRCLRKLDRAVRKGEYDEGSLAVCGRVYECPEDADRPPECAISTRSCAVGGPASPTLAALFFIGVWGRRRPPAEA